MGQVGRARRPTGWHDVGTRPGLQRGGDHAIHVFAGDRLHDELDLGVFLVEDIDDRLLPELHVDVFLNPPRDLDRGILPSRHGAPRCRERPTGEGDAR